LPIAEALNTLGIVRQSEDRYDEAAALLNRSLAIRERLAGKQSMEVASNLHNLGLVELNRGDNLSKAIEYFERSLAIKTKLMGDHNPDVEITQGDLGKALRAAKQRDRAVEILRSNLALARDLYGDESELVAGNHNELGYTFHDMGRFAEAAQEYRAAMKIRQKLGADKGASFAIPLNNLASAYEDMGDFAAAEPMFRHSLELRMGGQDAGSPLIANGEYNLARLLAKLARIIHEPGSRPGIWPLRGKHVPARSAVGHESTSADAARRLSSTLMCSEPRQIQFAGVRGPGDIAKSNTSCLCAVPERAMQARRRSIVRSDATRRRMGHPSADATRSGAPRFRPTRRA
jgi:tetratricopeptide (TPR) repeat protein